MRALHLLLLLCIAPLLGGCLLTTGTGSVMGGECKVFDRPDYVVLGKRRYDQNWIDGNIEAGVGGCGWKRPQARPPALDGGRAPAPKAKRGLRARVKAFVHREPAPPPAAVPVSQEATAPVVVPAVPPPPRDELLDQPAAPAPAPQRTRRGWCPQWLCR